MLLSIIIVNYNVKYFLEQCLCSVKKALGSGTGRETEVFVVDNHSTDGSLEYLQPRFPGVQFIGNQENTGYARANNQALKLARGEFVLFLNPDTVVPEDIFQKTISFMEEHPEAGALGVRMIDGSGRFLKESKRGLPTPWASFCKMAGLATLFPSSKTFASYYLGHLDPHKTQEAAVLSGAFLLARRQLLNAQGGFDERFFMYAEDIDLSYRVMQAGYKNYYLADTVIIHFKGESTRKDSRYVQLFYKAMRQFVQKHYRSGSGLIFSGLLNAAIHLRASLAMLRKPPTIKNESFSGVSLRGDTGEMNRLRQWLPAQQIRIQPGGNVLIFCEGNEYPFRQLIQSIGELGPHQQALVHASGSASIVGSFDKNGQGIGMNME